MVLEAVTAFGVGWLAYLWLAAFVAWRRTLWLEWIPLLLTLSSLLVISMVTWGISSEQFGRVVFILMIGGAFFLRPDKHLPGYQRLPDWLCFRQPDPALRKPKQPPAPMNEKAPSDDGRGLWVPHVPREVRFPWGVLLLIVISSMALLFVVAVFL